MTGTAGADFAYEVRDDAMSVTCRRCRRSAAIPAAVPLVPALACFVERHTGCPPRARSRRTVVRHVRPAA